MTHVDMEPGDEKRLAILFSSSDSMLWYVLPVHEHPRARALRTVRVVFLGTVLRVLKPAFWLQNLSLRTNPGALKVNIVKRGPGGTHLPFFLLFFLLVVLVCEISCANSGSTSENTTADLEQHIDQYGAPLINIWA